MIRAIRNEPFLWIAGVGFVVIIVSGLLPLDRATHVLWLFIVDSAVIAAAVGIQLVLQRKWASSAMRLEMGTTAIFLMAGFALFLLQGVLAGCLVAGSTLIAGLVARRRVRCDTCLPQCGDGPSVILAISVAAVGSAIALPLLWWSEPGRWLAGSPFAISISPARNLRGSCFYEVVGALVSPAARPARPAGLPSCDWNLRLPQFGYRPT